MFEIAGMKVFDILDIANMFQVTPQTIRRYIREGKLEANKMGTRWFITDESLKKYLSHNAAKSKQEHQE